MQTTTCWHCHKLAQMVRPTEDTDGHFFEGSYSRVPIFPDSRFSRGEEDDKFLLVYSCTACGYPNIAEAAVPIEVCEYGYDIEAYIVRWLPVAPAGKDYPGVPEDIASVASEVHKCFQIGAYRAAMTLARTALQGIVEKLDNEPSNKRLFERISELSKTGRLTARTAEAATAIRLCGNVTAHDAFVPIDHEGTEIVIEVLDSLIDDLYTHPSLVNKARAYAEAKKLEAKEVRGE